MYHVIIFGIHLTIDPVAFTIPGINWSIYWYGILIALGFSLAVAYAYKRAPEFGVNSDKLIDVAIISAPCGIIGARTYYMLFDSGTLSWSNFFDIHQGGLAIYGGVIFGVLAAAIMCKIKKLNIINVLDLCAPPILIGQAIGRWGNFFNQECFGGLTHSTWWGMSSENTLKVVGSGLVHPCFLYESLWCILGIIVLHKFSKHRKFDGQMLLSYIIWYGFGRFFIEGIRTDSLYIAHTSIRTSQLVAGLCVAIGVVLFAVLNSKAKEKALNSAAYVAQYDEADDNNTDEGGNIDENN